MNVYDFDKTIYNGDSSIDLYIFFLKNKPIYIFKTPIYFFMFFLYKIKVINKIRFKEFFFSFLKKIDDIESFINLFWNENEVKIKKWYLENKKATDLIISASPFFLLKEICNRLGVLEPIASVIDVKSGRFLSKNCYGEEKKTRFIEKYKEQKIDEFYSDSISDKPIATLANKKYLVKGNVIKEWRI